MIPSLFIIFGCSSSMVDTAEDILEMTSHRYVLSSMMYLNRSGKLFLFDQEKEEIVWELHNPDDPVWLDAVVSDDGTMIFHNVVDVKNHDPNVSEIRTIRPSGEIIDRISTPGAHHSFALYKDGFATITTEIREHPDYGKVAGDRVSYHHLGPSSTILSTFGVLNPEPVTNMWDFGHFEFI